MCSLRWRELQRQLAAHLPQAGLPLPAQVPGLLLQPLHFLGVDSSGLLKLGPEVSKFGRQGIHGALGQMGPSERS